MPNSDPRTEFSIHTWHPWKFLTILILNLSPNTSSVSLNDWFQTQDLHQRILASLLSTELQQTSRGTPPVWMNLKLWYVWMLEVLRIYCKLLYRIHVQVSLTRMIQAYATLLKKTFLCCLPGLQKTDFFAGSDQFLVCKTDSFCIKRIFFGPKKTHFADHILVQLPGLVKCQTVNCP